MREIFYSTVLVWFLTLSISASAEGVAAGDAVLNQDYAPLEKNPPVYPHVSQFNGIEGYCIVEYTVTTTGAVQDAFPEECQPIGLFEGISVEAALSFRYQPRVIDGVAVDVPGVKNKFVYDLRGPGKRMDFTNEPVRWSFIQENDTRRVNQRIEKQDWKKLKKYALSRKGPNYRMLYFAGFA